MAKFSKAFLACAVGICLLGGQASAFCVYNTGPSPVSFFAWPVAAQSFKAVVQPGGNSCCAFSNPTCFAKAQGDSSNNPLGQCAPVTFYITPQSVNTQQITNNFIAQKVFGYLGTIVSAVGVLLAPFTGGTTAAVVGITSAVVQAGTSISDAVTQTGIPFTNADIFQAASNGGTVTWDGKAASSTIAPQCAPSG